MSLICQIGNKVLDEIRSNRRQSLLLKNIDGCKYLGLYAVWYRHRCLYVGQSDKQTVYDRLYRHLSDCHNARLKLWIRVKDGELGFTSSAVCHSARHLIRGIERWLIEQLDPETNKVR